MLIHLVAGARPNFMKVAPLYHALKNEPWAQTIIVHTGQHYDLNMSKAFFRDLYLPDPDVHLNVGSGTHAQQTGQVMIAYEKVLLESRPDLVVVVGDVNSTLAATLAAAKLEIKVAHLEAGLRSFDRSMPEEINRLITDSISDILWTPSPDADANLIKEGIPKEKIIRVGNIMIDSLEMLREKIQQEEFYKKIGLQKGNYAVVTLHRPSNVDNPEILNPFCNILPRIAQMIPLIFPVHPRTLKSLERKSLLDLINKPPRITLLEPLNYTRFMNLVFNSNFVITDSGGIQEETTYLGIPCLTLRPSTERPITITQGTNQLCNVQDLQKYVEQILSKNSTCNSVPEFWDGKTASRIVKSIIEQLSVRFPEVLNA
jgi:UDP-N-acetylglucosamine 2-epimerase (non-hydrolysing)